MADKEKAKYVHYMGYKSINPKWREGMECHPVKSMSELNYLFNVKYKDAKYGAFDIETNTLNPEQEDALTAGFSFTFDGKHGYYVALKHVGYDTIESEDDENTEEFILSKEGFKTPHTKWYNLGRKALLMWYDKMTKLVKGFWANMMFDYTFLEVVEELDMERCPYYDIFVGLFLADTNVPFPNLKKSEKQYLGWDRDNFEATLGDNTNFSYVPIEDAYQYASYDALGTWHLTPISLKFYKEAKLSGKLDNEFIYPLIQFLKRGVKVDVTTAYKYQEEITKRVKDLEQDIHRMIGYSFNINSGAQLGKALTSIGFTTGQYTAKGSMKTGMEELEAANDKRDEPHPIVSKLVEYKKLSKKLSSAIAPAIHEGERYEDNEVRFNYHIFRVPTGRLASGGDKKNKYYAGWNAQSVEKPKSQMWYVHKVDPNNPDYKFEETDEIILGYRFSMNDKSEYWTEGLNPKWNIRNLFLPDENSYWVSMDYSAQELRCIANYAEIPVWVDTFLNGGDLHKNVAIQIWGEGAYNHDLRKRAKGANFGLSYGMAYTTAADKFKLSLSDAKELVDGWWSACKELKFFQDRTIRQAKKTGTVYNYFGRPRRVKWYFDQPDRKQNAFGERTVKNTVIQSIGADLCKLASIKFYRKMLKNPKYKDKVRFLSTVHDEINISVNYEDLDLFYEMVKAFYDIMVVQVPGWRVPFAVGIEISNRWGGSLAWHWTEDGRLEPDVEPVPKDEPKKGEPKEQPKKEEKKEEFSFDEFDITF